MEMNISFLNQPSLISIHLIYLSLSIVFVYKTRQSSFPYTYEIYFLEILIRIADRAMQVLGGNGYVAQYNVERLWRDAKLLEIGYVQTDICIGDILL